MQVIGNANYDQQATPMEDMDFSAQIIAQGKQIAIDFAYTFTCLPVGGSNTGGLYETYKQLNKIKRNEYLKEKWKDYIWLSSDSNKVKWQWKKLATVSL